MTKFQKRQLTDAATVAIEQIGGCTAMGRALGIGKSAVYKWKLTGVPPQRVGHVSALTGIPVATLRPDLFAAAA